MKIRKFTEKIITQRLILVGRVVPTKEMAVSFTNLILKNRQFLKKWVSLAWKEINIENSFKACQKSSILWHNGQEADYNIYLKDGTLIGQINMKDINYKIESGEIGYYLAKEFTHQGYMTEAIKALENDFFERGMHRIQICATSKNKASIAVAKKCGYKQEAKLMNNSLDPSGNHIQDTVILAKINK